MRGIKAIIFPHCRGIQWMDLGEDRFSTEESIVIHFSPGGAGRRRDVLKWLIAKTREGDSDWLEYADGNWRIDLDGLRNAFHFLRSYTWLKGKMEIEPEIEPDAQVRYGQTTHEWRAEFMIERAHVEMANEKTEADAAQNLSYLAMHEQMQNEIAEIKAHVEINKQIERTLNICRPPQWISEMTASASVLAAANQSLASAIRPLAHDTSLVNSFANLHKTWVETVLPGVNWVRQFESAANLTLGMSSRISALAEGFRVKIDYPAFQANFRFQDDFLARFSEMMHSTEQSFSRLAASLDIPTLGHIPSMVMPSASREILVSEYAITQLSPGERPDADCIAVVQDVATEVSGVGGLIEQVNPKLAMAYEGAKDALRTKNADYARHVLSSLREMWSNLLRTLAPDEVLLPWIGNNGSYLHEGKPTRRARMDYICRDFNHEPLCAFMSHDTKAFVSMIDFFNHVHQLETGLTDTQLQALILRSDSWLMFILQIDQGRN